MCVVAGGSFEVAVHVGLDLDPALKVRTGSVREATDVATKVERGTAVRRVFAPYSDEESLALRFRAHVPNYTV